jgi:hypothetical protein
MVKGPSLFWTYGSGSTFYKGETVDYLVDYMEIGIIRAAMAIKYDKERTGLISDKCGSCQGYLSDPDIRPSAKSSTKTLVKNIINAAIINDIYVIVDWHSHNANDEKVEAVAFFKEMALEYPNTPNIIWEIYNEPVNDDANIIKSYANDVISAIRSTGNENLIVVGSNTYSQKPNEQAGSGITDSKNNTAYSFHFYSGTHSYSKDGDIGGSANSARNAGHSVFATEWGSVNADGGGTPNFPTSWVNFMDTSNTSGCYWSASDINEGASIFKNGTKIDDLVKSTSANYTRLFTSSGTVFQTYMGTKKWNSYAPASTNPRGKDFSASVEEGNSVTWSSTDLGLTNGATVKSATVIKGTGTVTNTPNSVTYNSEDDGASQVYIQYVVTGGGKDIKQRIVVNITGLKPILSKIDPIEVSHRAPNYISAAALSPMEDPGGAWNTLEFSDASVTGGATAVVKNKDTITFTPPASIRDVFTITPFELTYKVKSTATNKVSVQTVTLNARNFRPTTGAINDWSIWNNNVPNTEPYTFTPGSDKDKDPLKVVAFYMPSDYPGTLTANSDSTALIYTPAAQAYKGYIKFLVVVTDGINKESTVGGYRLRLVGDGEQIPTNLPSPNQIPGYSPIKSVPIYAGGISLQSFRNGKLLVNFAKSGSASLELYSISGAKVASLISGNQTAGSQEFNVSNLQKGVYIARLKQGSEVKVQRVVVR